MPTQYGTLSVVDTLDTYNNQSVLDMGEDQVNGFVAQILDSYNALVGEMTSDLIGYTTLAEDTYGIDANLGEMVDLDEYGLADAQKFPFAPSSVGFPLRRKGGTLQWTRDYLARTTPSQLARQVLGLTEADTRAIYASIRRALFTATNNTTYVDRLLNNRTYTIRALLNADGQGVPPQPVTGATFNGATHTHYLATATLVEANVTALEETVREHGIADGAGIRIYINSAQEAAYRAFAGFNAYTDTRIIYSDAANRAAGTIDTNNLEDRAIGFHGPAEVSVKPWVPANYHVCFRAGGTGAPVLGWRRPDGPLAQEADLRIVAKLDRHPLHAEAYSRVFGIAPWNRTRAAVLYSGGATFLNFAG